MNTRVSGEHEFSVNVRAIVDIYHIFPSQNLLGLDDASLVVLVLNLDGVYSVSLSTDGRLYFRSLSSVDSASAIVRTISIN